MHTNAHRPQAPLPTAPTLSCRPPSSLFRGKALQTTQLNRASQCCSRVSTQILMVASKLKSRPSSPLYYRRAGLELRARRDRGMDVDLAPNLRHLGLRKKRQVFNGCSSFRITTHVTPYLTMLNGGHAQARVMDGAGCAVQAHAHDTYTLQ